MTPTLPLEGVPSEYDIRTQQCIQGGREAFIAGGSSRTSPTGRSEFDMYAGFSTFIDDEGNAGNLRSSEIATERIVCPAPLLRFQFELPRFAPRREISSVLN
jgi:hypothetical protein